MIHEKNKNTTLIAVITNLKLDDNQLKQMNNQVTANIGKIIRPYNTFLDGDINYFCSLMEKENKMNNDELIDFFDKVSDVLEESIINSIVDL